MSVTPKKRILANQEDYNAILRSDFQAFCENTFEEVTGKVLRPNWHIEALTHKLEDSRTKKTKRLLMALPPRMLKSTVATVAFPAFILGHDPTATIMCVSHSERLATHFSLQTSQAMNSGWYKAAFPGTRIERNPQDIITTTKRGFRKAKWVGGSITGEGGDYIIVDDPIDASRVSSPLERKAVNDYFRHSLYQRQESQSESVIIVAMQRLHEDDLFGVLEREGGWEVLSLPAIAPADQDVDLGGGRSHHWRKGEPLHDDRLSLASLASTRTMVGSSAFSAQYLQSPVAQEGDIIKREWIKRYSRPPERDCLKITQSWDTAMTGNSSASHSACTTWGELNGDHFLLHVFRAQLEFSALIKAVVDLHGRFQPSALLIENKASGLDVISYLRHQHNIVALAQNPKQDKETRLNQVQPVFERGQVILPKDAPWLADYEHEMFGFPNVTAKDQVDSTSQYLLWVERPNESYFFWDFG